MAATPQQMDIMINFIDENPQLANNYVANTVQGRQAINLLWTNLASKLNACGLPNKSTTAWRKVWTDCKYRAKKKCSNNLSSMQKTGGGRSEEVPLSPMEEKVAALASLRDVVAGSCSKSFGAASAFSPADDDEDVYLRFSPMSNHDDEIVVVDLSEEMPSGSNKKRNAPVHTRAPTPKRRFQNNQNESVEIIKCQLEADKVFQHNILAVLIERNTQDAAFQAKVIKLFQFRNEIAEKQLEHDTKKTF